MSSDIFMCNIHVQSFGNGHAQTSLHYFCSTKFLIALLFDNIHFITHTTYYKGGRDKKFKVYEPGYCENKFHFVFFCTPLTVRPIHCNTFCIYCDSFIWKCMILLHALMVNQADFKKVVSANKTDHGSYLTKQPYTAQHQKAVL